MRILYVNNYFSDYISFEKCFKGELSLSHLWGIDSVMNDDSNEKYYLECSDKIPKIKNRCMRFLLTVCFQLKLLFKYIFFHPVDIVYSVSAHQIDILQYINISLKNQG